MNSRDKILEACRTPKSFRELKGITGLSDAGLSKALKSLLREGLLTKTERGYVITEKGGMETGEESLIINGIYFTFRGVDEEVLKKIASILENFRDFHICVGRSELNPEDGVREVLLITLEDTGGGQG